MIYCITGNETRSHQQEKPQDLHQEDRLLALSTVYLLHDVPTLEPASHGMNPLKM